jgi:hypothetical protein
MRDHLQRSVRSPGRRSRLRDAIVVLWIITSSVAMSGFRAEASAPSVSSSASQSEISAAFIFNFAKFTEWPPESFVDSNSAIAVCFLEAAEVRSAFQSIAAGKGVNGRSLLVREVKSSVEIHDCQIVYTDSQTSAVIVGVLKNSRKCSALSIGTSEDFLARGGTIRLLVESNRMRFDVNLGGGRTDENPIEQQAIGVGAQCCGSSRPGGKLIWDLFNNFLLQKSSGL